MKANQNQDALQASQPSFHDVLKLLGEVHEQEIAALKNAAANLRSEELAEPTSPKTFMMNIPSQTRTSNSRTPAGFLSPNLSRRPSDSSNASAVTERTECWCNVNPATSEKSELALNSSTLPNGTSPAWARRKSMRVSVISTQDLGRSDLRQSICGNQRLTVTGKVYSKTFELLAWWVQDAEGARCSFARRSRTFSNLLDRIGTGVEVVTSGRSRLQPLVLHPSSFKRLAWDLTSMVLLAYDIITVPFVGAFNPDASTFLVFMTWATAIFWNLDLLMSCLTGYQSGKQLILAPEKIFKRFAKSWMLLDVSIVSFDWILIGMGEQDSGSAARLGRSLRTLRFVRTLRLLRVLKLKRILQEIQDNINTETLSIWFGISKIIVCLVVANHIVACGWYTVGTVNNSEGGWVKTYDMDQRTIAYQYTSSLHWSLTQFTPASMEVVPQNVGERIFAVLILLVAMIAFSSFVSILTALMGELRSIHNDETRQFWMLRRYLRDWSVSRNVGKRVQQYLEYAYNRQRQKVQEKDVSLLALLSEALRAELKYEIHASVLQCHPFFSRCTDEWMRFISRAIENAPYAQGDIIFACGDVGYSLHFVSTGCVEYARGVCKKVGVPLTTVEVDVEEDDHHDHLDMDNLVCDSANLEYLNGNAWIAEAALWCPWAHLGDLQAVVECTIVTIDRDRFGESVQANTNLYLNIRKYAANFLRELNKLDSQDLTDLVHRSFPLEFLLEGHEFPPCSAKHHSHDDYMDTGINHMKRRLKKRLTTWLGKECDPAKVEPMDEAAPIGIRSADSSGWCGHSITPAPVIKIEAFEPERDGGSESIPIRDGQHLM